MAVDPNPNAHTYKWIGTGLIPLGKQQLHAFANKHTKIDTHTINQAHTQTCTARVAAAVNYIQIVCD